MGWFAKGIGYEPERSMEELIRGYRRAYRRYYEPFFDAHPQMLENLLIYIKNLKIGGSTLDSIRVVNL